MRVVIHFRGERGEHGAHPVEHADESAPADWQLSHHASFGVLVLRPLVREGMLQPQPSLRVQTADLWTERDLEVGSVVFPEGSQSVSRVRLSDGDGWRTEIC